MKQEYTTGNATLIRGRAWHVFPDPAGSGALIGDHPFGADEPPGRERTPVRMPDGIVDAWLVGKNAPGIRNAHDGHTYLVLTERLEPPPVTAGWLVEVARLDEDFQLDQRGGRWVHLVRVVATAETPEGPVQDCEFQIDRD